jgi:hypothetical protein
MIDFLKESTFKVNDVINKSWEVLQSNYKNIAGLCFTMFIVLFMSGFLSSLVSSEINWFAGIIIVIIFIVAYFGLQLTLFNYILLNISDKENDNETAAHKFLVFLKDIGYRLLLVLVIVAGILSAIGVIVYLLHRNEPFLTAISVYFVGTFLFQILTISILLLVVLIVFWDQIRPFFEMIRDYWPTNLQLFNFTLAMLCSGIVTLLTFVLIAVLLFPLVYLKINMERLVNIAVSLGGVTAMMVLIRISFFPFFILSLNTSPFKAIRFSLAITKGNFTRLLLLIGLTVIFIFMGAYLQAYEYYLLSLAISLMYFFIVVPLSSVGVGVVYKQMMDEYEGDSDPDIIHNII